MTTAPSSSASMPAIPAPGDDIDAAFERLVDYVSAHAGPDASKYAAMMRALADPVPLAGLEISDAAGGFEPAAHVSLGLKHAPAGRAIHHACYGGLVAHIMEMLALAPHYLDAMSRLSPEVAASDFLAPERVIQAVLAHDLHKSSHTFCASRADLDAGIYNVRRINHATDKLMGSDVKSLWLLAKHGICPDPVVVNALLNAEGGFADIKTPWVTSLAKLVAVLDESSASIMSRAESNTEYNALVPSHRPWADTYKIK